MFGCWAEEKQQPRDMGGAGRDQRGGRSQGGGAEGFSVVPGTERVLPLLLFLCFNCLAQCLLALNKWGGRAINAVFASHGPPSLGGGFGGSGES